MKKLFTILIITLILTVNYTFAQSPAQGWSLNYVEDDFNNDAMLDLSYLNEETAGENGFIKLSPDGEGFVNENGEEVRFWASGGGGVFEGDAYTQYAKFLAKKGVNMTRFHGDVVSVTDDINEPNAEELDRIWRMVSVMKEEGIYSTISPFWAGHAPDMREAWGLGDYVGDISPWALMYFNDKFKNAYKNWVEKLFTEENPYTGIPLKDDPAVGLIQIKNEDGLFFWTIQGVEPSLQNEIDSQFYDWVIDKYGTTDAAYDAWDGVTLDTDDPENQIMGTYIIWEATQDQTGGKAKRLKDQINFYSDIQRGFYEEIYTHLRDIGCQQLINATNWKTADPLRLFDAERYTNAVTDVMAVNRYYSPGHIGPNSGWRTEPGHYFEGASVLGQPHKLPINIKQVDSKPFFVTESAWNLPNAHQAEGVFLISAYMSLTGVDGYYWFSPTSTGFDPEPYFTFTEVDGQYPMHRWTVSIPGQIGMFPANALMYRNGYIQKGSTVVHEERTLESIYNREIPIISEENSFDPNRDSGNPVNTGDDTEISPLAYLTGQVKVTYDAVDDSKTIDEELNNLISFENKTIKSITGELEWNYGDSIVLLDAPAAKGLTGFPGDTESFTLSDVTIETENDYVTVNVVSMDQLPIKESESILIQIGTKYRPRGWRESKTTFQSNDTDVEGYEVLDVGEMPWKAANTYATVTINNPNIKSAYLLDLNGYEEKELFVETNPDNDNKKIQIPRDGMYIVVNTREATVTEPNAITSIEDKSSTTSNNLTIYPNPTTGEVNIHFDDSSDAFDTITIMDLKGKVLDKISNPSAQFSLDLPNGYYIMKLSKTNGWVKNKKILIKR